MEIRGIDVSAWQGKIDWKTVADYGMGFAILRITERDMPLPPIALGVMNNSVLQTKSRKNRIE